MTEANDSLAQDDREGTKNKKKKQHNTSELVKK